MTTSADKRGALITINPMAEAMIGRDLARGVQMKQRTRSVIETRCRAREMFHPQ